MENVHKGRSRTRSTASIYTTSYVARNNLVAIITAPGAALEARLPIKLAEPSKYPGNQTVRNNHSGCQEVRHDPG